MATWGFLTNHLHALYCVARRPGIRIVEVAECVGVRERAAHRLVTDLVEGGYLTRRRVGTRNFYELHPTLPLRREGLDEVSVGEILKVLLKPTQAEPAHGPEAPTSQHPGEDPRDEPMTRQEPSGRHRTAAVSRCIEGPDRQIRAHAAPAQELPGGASSAMPEGRT